MSLNEPMSVVLKVVRQLGGWNVPLSQVLAALPPGPFNGMYIDDLASMGLIVVAGGRVSLTTSARADGARVHIF